MSKENPATAEWIQIKARCTSKNADAISDLMEALGALAVTYQDAEDSPILEPLPGERRLWPNTEVTGLYAIGTDGNEILNKLKAILGDHQPLAVVGLEERDWIRAWMDQFKPLRFGEHLWICPSWLKVDDPKATVVMLDPGLAFGTGTHPTTAQCLEFLEGCDLKGKRVLDYGCGSGILAVTALKLGAASACGIDIDEQALEASAENAKRNEVKSQLTLYLGGKLPGDLKPFPVTVANILAGPLTALEPILAKLTAQGGRLALSGVLTEQTDEIMAAYAQDFVMDAVKSREGWALLTGTRR